MEKEQNKSIVKILGIQKGNELNPIIPNPQMANQISFDVPDIDDEEWTPNNTEDLCKAIYVICKDIKDDKAAFSYRKIKDFIQKLGDNDNFSENKHYLNKDFRRKNNKMSKIRLTERQLLNLLNNVINEVQLVKKGQPRLNAVQKTMKDLDEPDELPEREPDDVYKSNDPTEPTKWGEDYIKWLGDTGGIDFKTGLGRQDKMNPGNVKPIARGRTQFDIQDLINDKFRNRFLLMNVLPSELHPEGEKYKQEFIAMSKDPLVTSILNKINVGSGKDFSLENIDLNLLSPEDREILYNKASQYYNIPLDDDGEPLFID